MDRFQRQGKAGPHRSPACRRADKVLERARPEPERLTREVLSIRHAPVQHHPNATQTSVARSTGTPDAQLTAFPLVSPCVEPPAGIEPATPSLPWNHQEPLCGPPFPQLTPDRSGQSYRFSFGEVMRSPTNSSGVDFERALEDR